MWFRIISTILLLSITVTARAQSTSCPVTGPNLIVNGNFEQGYYGFTSDFGRGVNNATMGNCATQGWILVTETNPHVSSACDFYPPGLSALYGGPNTLTSSDPNHPSNTSTVTLAICSEPLDDHTPGGRFFLAIDPDGIVGRAYWKQTITVCAQTNYIFSVWIRNVTGGCGMPAPNFHFEVGGIPINAPTSYPDCFWVNTSANWNSGSVEGPVSIELINDLPGCDANDAAIDDVFFGRCDGVLLTCDPQYSFCGDSSAVPIRLSGNAYGFSAPQLQWQHFDPLAAAWLNIPGATDSVYTLSFVSPATTGLYRLVAGNGTSLSAGCYAASEAVEILLHPVYDHLIEMNICRGETFSGYSTPGLYVDTLQSVAGCDSIRTLDLRVHEDYETKLSITHCPGSDYYFDGISLNSSGTYQAIFPSIHGCDSLVMLDLTIPSSSFLGNDTVICAAAAYRLTSPSALTVWFDNSTGTAKVITESGRYFANTMDAHGCILVDTIVLQFNIAAFVPNVFSPNDDGINDVFLPNFSETNFRSYNFQVFDRWGSQVFQTTEPHTGWPGKCRASACEAGVYFYFIEIETGFCEKTLLKGDVSLMK